MTAIPPPPLLRYWLPGNPTAAWLRLGKIAIISVLAALSIAGGMAQAGNQAAAQGSQNGYTYTQRVCQEYGQQPRHYQVRDPIAGSDWRSDGGWAIILERGAHTVTKYALNATGYYAASTFHLYYLDDPANGVERIQLIDGRNGNSAFRRYSRSNQRFTSQIVFDLNNDGAITVADQVPHPQNPGQMLYRTGYFNTYQEPYGTSYIRWADMAWCR